MHKKNLIVGSIVLLTFVVSLLTVNTAKAAVLPVTGWAWSSNTGWVSFSSTNSEAPSVKAFAVNVSTTTANPTIGTFSGYAWSSNVGWISFNAGDVTNCPTDTGAGQPIAGCTPAMNFATGQVSGWAKVISMTSGNGGEGWIELSGANHPGSTGVSYNSSTKTLGGFAWEPVAVGWLNFSPCLSDGNCGGNPPIVVPPTCVGCVPNTGGSLALSCSQTSIVRNADNTAADVSFRVTISGGSSPFALSHKTNGSQVNLSGTQPFNFTVHYTSSGSTIVSATSSAPDNFTGNTTCPAVSVGDTTPNTSAPNGLYIGTSETSIQNAITKAAAGTGLYPTSLRIPYGIPFVLHWKIDSQFESGDNCTKSISTTPSTLTPLAGWNWSSGSISPATPLENHSGVLETTSGAMNAQVGKYTFKMTCTTVPPEGSEILPVTETKSANLEITESSHQEG